MSIEKIKKEFEREFIEIDNIINNGLSSEVELINDISSYITLHSGKRVRPLITILLSLATGYKGYKHLILSSVIELIHTATLLHDDVVDESEKRRGMSAVNIRWGNSEAILVGDYLYTKAFQMMLDVNNFKIFKIISSCTNIMAEGEALQLLNRNRFDVTEDECLKVIVSKTAQLFIASSSVGAILGKCNDRVFNLIRKYGLHIGIAYQLVDDVLDYTIMCNDKFGKNVGDDFLKGVFNIPFIYAMKFMTKKDKCLVYDILKTQDKRNFFKIRDMIIHYGGIDYSVNLVKKEVFLANKSLSVLKKSKYSDMLYELSEFLTKRIY